MSKQSKTSGRRRAAPTTTGRKSERRGSRTLSGRTWAGQPAVRVLGALIVGLVVGMVASSGLRKVVADHPEARSWQYGRLSVAVASVNWRAPDRQYSGAGLKGLYGHLAETEAPANVTPAEIINLIGGHGWELVSVSYGNTPRSADNYWFRRLD